MTQICVAIKAKTTEQTIEDIIRAEEADIIELRLDYRTEPLNLETLRVASPKPLIATNRRVDQGGVAEETESERIELLYAAVEAGFDIVDLSETTMNLAKHVKQFQGRGVKVIASYHDFKNALNENKLEEKHIELCNTGCDYVKIIGWAYNYPDNLPYLRYNRTHPGNISFAMGETGTPSRILAPLAGAAYTYASLDEEVAPGQIPLWALRETYRSLQP